MGYLMAKVLYLMLKKVRIFWNGILGVEKEHNRTA